jgi:hypothetical protein
MRIPEPTWFWKLFGDHVVDCRNRGESTISEEKSGEIESEMHKVYFIQTLSPRKDRLKN